MNVQTDQELLQNETKTLNKKFKVDIFTTNIRDGKAFVAAKKF